ncbi:aspartate kinase [Hydrogenibacillus sp. N12]|uniref:aspartate kinase n=1 Tax=Hydrogenibacillus sp. N12 TaxID=2866627 RepID=UPI001C7D8AB2|nr:aspartate kinase [Hydrogenibacillus sp. N12]
MDIIVQKFGGTSVADEKRRRRVIEHIRRALGEGYRVVAVVSAMGRRGDPYATDTLLDLVGGERTLLPPRERDLLLSTGEIISAAVLAQALWEAGIPNTVLTGGQAGIVTTDHFTRAEIVGLRPERVRDVLALGHVAVVAGFQGQSADGEITTFGRGGSDTTAAALGVALEARAIEIFTDVDGIMTADPRIAPEARPIRTMTYVEVANFAYLGAKVIHPRAVELAMQKNIPIRVRGTMSDDAGTLIAVPALSGATAVRERVVTGITQTPGVTQIRVEVDGVDPMLPMAVFGAMAENGISVDLINVFPRGVVYTVRAADAPRAQALLEAKGFRPAVTPGCAKVSVIGAGMAGRPGVMATIVSALTAAGIEILQSADSHTTIWVLVREDKMTEAVRVLHRAFRLGEGDEAGGGPSGAEGVRSSGRPAAERTAFADLSGARPGAGSQAAIDTGKAGVHHAVSKAHHGDGHAV